MPITNKPHTKVRAKKEGSEFLVKSKTEAVKEKVKDVLEHKKNHKYSEPLGREEDKEPKK